MAIINIYAMLGKRAIMFRSWLLLFCGTGTSYGQDISGYWQGVLIQPRGGLSIYYPYSMTVQQTQNGNVTGTSLTLLANTDYYVRHSLSGSISNNVFNCQSQKIADLTPRGSKWCNPGVRLTYNPSAGTLTGPWSEPNCGSGTFEIWRLGILSGTTFCEGAVGYVAVSGINVRWYTDSLRTRLVATGNSFLPNISATTTFYVTQTHYNNESPALPVLVTIKPKQHVTVKDTICKGQRHLGYIDSGTYSDTFPLLNDCDSVRILHLTVRKDCEVAFPTAVTPNNDGRNDMFRMLKPYDVSKIQLTIFNRWGVKVFETKDPDAGWDGRFKGVTQGAGIYVWFCTYTKGGHSTQQKGTFMLLR